MGNYKEIKIPEIIPYYKFKWGYIDKNGTEYFEDWKSFI